MCHECGHDTPLPRFVRDVWAKPGAGAGAQCVVAGGDGGHLDDPWFARGVSEGEVFGGGERVVVRDEEGDARRTQRPNHGPG